MKISSIFIVTQTLNEFNQMIYYEHGVFNESLCLILTLILT